MAKEKYTRIRQNAHSRNWRPECATSRFASPAGAWMTPSKVPVVCFAAYSAPLVPPICAFSWHAHAATETPPSHPKRPQNRTRSHRILRLTAPNHSPMPIQACGHSWQCIPAPPVTSDHPRSTYVPLTCCHGNTTLTPKTTTETHPSITNH